jgi:hypothetical protein
MPKVVSYISECNHDVICNPYMFPRKIVSDKDTALYFEGLRVVMSE